MTVIILSFAVGSVTLGVLLGKLLKHAAKIGTVEPPLPGGMLPRGHYEDVMASSASTGGERHTQLIPNSNEI